MKTNTLIKKTFQICGIILFPMIVNAQCAITEKPFSHGQSTPNSVWFTADNVGYVVGQGISKTLDGGKSWSSMINAPKVYLRSSMFTSPAVGFITGPAPKAGEKTPIWKTMDAGSTWQSMNTPQDVTSSFYRGLFMVDENIGYAGLYTSGGVMIKTIDGGNNWFKITPAGSSTILGIYFHDPFVGYVGTTEGLFQTKDGGQNWVKKIPSQAQGPYIFSIHFADPLNGYAVGEDYFNSPLKGPLYKTSDGGESWELMGRVMNRTKEVYALSPDTAYICGTGQLWSTFDGGKTWDKVFSSATSELYDIHFPSKRVGYSVGHSNGNVKIEMGNPKPSVNFFVNGSSLITNTIPGATFQWYKRNDTLPFIPKDTLQSAVTPVWDASETGFYSVCATLNGCTGCSPKEILVNIVPAGTSIKDQLGVSLAILPNPAKENFKVQLKNTTGQVSVKLVNTLGQTVLSESYQSTGDDKWFTTSGLRTGVYSVTVKTDKGTATRRLLIQ